MKPIQDCEECHRLFNTYCLFRGRWICMECYKRFVAERDFKYYNNLAKQNSKTELIK